MLDWWFGGVDEYVWFLFSFFWEGGEWDDPYHDGGRVVGISAERERESQREMENIANIRNTTLVKTKAKEKEKNK